ncbi:adenomatous polyposis coli protein 2 isoform X1 [Acipenser oxyrinchus oxyrinchus]|uniref:Adenomatous polyposis coli protein 2 n=1 Tax=Acipenser oxyrinchus oxyrinchus TaxID=40147 RepID=A0AAD8FT85_ACIOX|nr:adenomatous polyposis coli protein 2 isoform X1 [Acipenser oxyrinchus oxyrinchus]
MGLLWLHSLLQSTLFGNEVLGEPRMTSSGASYQQLVRQVEALRKENTHLRRELEDNSSHLSKLENETSDMKEILKQLQCKLEQEARTLASSGRTDVLDQLKELHMDLTNYYELKYQPHNLRVAPEAPQHCGEEGSRLAPPGSASDPRAGEESLLHSMARQGPSLQGEAGAQLPGSPHSLEKGAAPGDGRVTVLQLEQLDKERTLLLGEIEKEEKERRWYYIQLQGLSKRLSELPRIDTFSVQMDLIRQQLEFEAQQLRSVMEERFGTGDEMVQRTQIRVARLEQLDKELQEAQDNIQHWDPQIHACGKPVLPDSESAANNSVSEAPSDTGSKVEMVFWMLSMLASRDREEMSRTLLTMSSSQESCLAMRKSGCVPLLVQILHDGAGAGPGAGGCSREARNRASAALHNMVYCQQDEGQARREMRVLHVLEQIRAHCEGGWDWLEAQRNTAALEGKNSSTALPDPVEPHICQAMCAVMKLSFEEEYRRAMNELGGLQAVADLTQLDYELYGMNSDPLNMALRRYAGMALTNLTFGDVVNKAMLCSKKGCLQAIVAQLASDSEEQHQVVSSILRNLSWRADINSKKVLREVGSVAALMTCALQATKESTLKSLLSALWNLSAHSTENKVSICSVDGALGFLVSTLTYKCQSNSLAIIESGGGILRNVSSLVATREDYRQILRDHNCLQTLLQHLRSHSLTIVSNACGTLWNLSARSPKDQELLWDLGAVSMLRNLINSKHKMIAMGSAAALRNLLTNRPLKYKDAAVISPGSCMPSLYMRKQKALEAELDAKHLAETFDSIEKQNSKHPSINKPLRHIESLSKDYASDSGCFDDDEAPNNSTSLDTSSFSAISMFLNSSNFLQGQPRKKAGEPERDTNSQPEECKKIQPEDDEVSLAAEKLAKKISTTVAKIDKLVEDITLHTSSEDSFSLSSEDHFVDWQYGSDELHEARAKSCSPCRLSDTSSFARRERLSRAHALLRLKTAYTSLSTDSLNSGSTSDSYCGSKDQVRPSARSATIQRRPTRLDLKVAQQDYPEKSSQSHKDAEERAVEGKRNMGVPNQSSTEKCQEPPLPTPATLTSNTSEASVPTIKLSPSYHHVPLIQSVPKFGVSRNPVSPHAPQGPRRQAWLPTVANNTSLGKLSSMGSARSPTLAQLETVQKYAVENTPICFSRCSSLSSLSSGDGALDGQSHSENELDSDSSLEIIEVEECELEKTEEDCSEDLSEDRLDVPEQKQFISSSSISSSQPIEIPCPAKREKVFLREVSPARHEDMTPSSSSENYIHETPLVMSRCSSVSSLGSFESRSIDSSIQSDPCSEMISGTISPSDLPDSPGQTMPPSRSKTPCCLDPSGQEREGGQWESNIRKFMEIADFKERFNLPPDLDTMIYFTVEKPTENFSCASSLSALPLHEHYIQKDVELKLMPLLPAQESLNFTENQLEREEAWEKRSLLGLEKSTERYGEGNSDDDIEILKECINSAMPSKFRKVKTTLMSSLSTQVLNSQARKSMQLPVYMLVPTHATQIASGKNGRPDQDFLQDDSSFTDSAEGTPVNFSSAASLSDETLQYPLKDEQVLKDQRVRRMERQVLIPVKGKSMGDPHSFSHLLKSTSMAGQGEVTGNKSSKVVKRVMPAQGMPVQNRNMTGSLHRSRDQTPAHLYQRQEQSQPKNLPNLNLPVRKQTAEAKQSQTPNQLDREYVHGNVAFQSMRHTTPTEEAIYCFYDNDLMDAERKDCRVTSSGKKHGKEVGRSTPARTIPEADLHQHQSFHRQKGMVSKVKHNMIMDETPPCYSLSSSLSSLSDVDLQEHEGKVHQVWTKTRRQGALSRARDAANAHVIKSRAMNDEDSSPSSISLDSDDDLVQRCITSAMPMHRRRHSARRRKAERKQKLKSNLQKAMEGWSSARDQRSDDVVSDKDSDLNSVEWRAIQEGANSIVNKLQAASLTKEPSSESESVLSFVSGLSVGSTIQLTLESRDKKSAQKDSKEHGKSPKIADSRNSRTQLDFGQRKPVPNLPVVFRGRTVIYMPTTNKNTASPQRSTPKKMSPKTSPKTETTVKNPNLAQQRSRSLHRLGRPGDMADLTVPKRSVTPPARMTKGGSSGSSQNSTPSKQPQKKLTSPTQAGKQLPTKPFNRTAERKTNNTATPPAPKTNTNIKSPAHKKTQKSPVRIPFMQASSKQTGQSRTISPFLNNQPPSGPRPNTQLQGKRFLTSNRLELVRMSSTRSSGSESDRSGFLRQLTFIKESPSRLRQRGEFPSSRSVPTSQCASPRKTQTTSPAVFLCSSRCQELKAGGQGQGSQKQGQPLSRASSGDKYPAGERPARRTSSESPSRIPQKKAPGACQQERETFKRHASSPHINVLKRATSPSSILSSSSDSSGKAKNEEDRKTRQQRQMQQQQQQGSPRANGKVTWRRIRDEDVPHILKSTLPSTALPLLPSPDGHKQMPQLHGKLPTVSKPSRKTSDATVQTENLCITKTNSSTSPSMEKAPPITEEATKSVTYRKISTASGGSIPILEGELAEFKNHNTITSSSNPGDGHTGGVGHFRQSSPSRAVRVTPFNYIPSPIACGSQSIQIRVPTLNEKPGEKLEA